MGFIRDPRTTAERRANQEGWCRASRNPHNLPDSYDDIICRPYVRKSWKYYRGHQYRVVEIKEYDK